MLLRITIAAALAAASAGTASAQTNSDQDSVNVAGNVASLCVLGAPSRSSIDLGALISTSGTRAGRLAVLGSQSATLPGSFCNFAGTTLTVSAVALVADDASTVQPGFARAVNYNAAVSNWAATNATVTTAATAGGATPSASSAGGIQGTPKIADLTLTLGSFAVPGDALLVAGGYAGTVTITLGPAATPN